MDYFKNISVTKDDADRVDWKNVLASCSGKAWHDYSLAFFDAAHVLRQQEDEQGAQALIVIGSAAQMHFNADHPEGPFQPLIRMAEARSAGIDDFANEHLDLFSAMIAEVDDEWLRARLGDILWVRKKDYQSAKIAVEAYLLASQNLPTELGRPVDTDLVERAVSIAKQLGRSNDLFKTTVQFVEDLLTRPDVQTTYYQSAHPAE